MEFRLTLMEIFTVGLVMGYRCVKVPLVSRTILRSSSSFFPPSTLQVWNPDGVLLGKFFLGTTSANMVFAGPGTLAILAETKIVVAKIAANGFSLGGPQ